MKRTFLRKRITISIISFALAVLPVHASAAAGEGIPPKAGVHDYSEGSQAASFSEIGTASYNAAAGEIPVGIRSCGDTRGEGIGVNSAGHAYHVFGSEYYTGVNRHVGSQHQVQYAKKCSLCGYTLYWWGEPYPCPGNGYCIVPNAMEPAEK